MIQAICVDGKPNFQSIVRGLPIYLDTFAYKALAKGDQTRRKRFVAALDQGADLLFSITNCLELSGAEGNSAECIRSFLSEVGANWFPIEMVPTVVIERENKGLPPSQCCLAEELLRAYFANRTCDHLPGSGKIIDLSSSFFQLGKFCDWLSPRKDHYVGGSRALDAAMMNSMVGLRRKHKGDSGWLDREMPAPQFHPSRAAAFAYMGFMRQLIRDSGVQLRKGDGLDFCHAVMATSFATFAALDKQWKRRVENLPKPNQAARIYYEPELDAMVTDIEIALRELKRRAAAQS